jgi:hypothetical protein
MNGMVVNDQAIAVGLELLAFILIGFLPEGFSRGPCHQHLIDVMK